MRARREPPRFRRVGVQAVERLTPRMVRLTLTGAELAGLTVDEPAASVRLLLPSAPDADLVMPVWNGNEFLLPDGRRPTIRTFTPRHVDPKANTLDLDIVVHGGGAASEWVTRVARPGAPAAVSGPGRGYTVDPDASAFVLAGDETAIPAISQLLEALPHHARVRVLVEAATPEARLDLPPHPNATIEWVDDLVDAVRDTEIESATRVWAAGEAATMQRIRKHLFDERGVPRAHATVRGYWKHGRTADSSPDFPIRG